MERPKVVVGVVITDDKGNILLGKGRKWSGKWTIFGGHVENGEQMIEAVKREAKEETGLDIENMQHIGIRECINDPLFHKPKHFVFIDFWGVTQTKEVVHNDEFLATKWCTPKEALEQDLVSYSREAIEEYLKKYS